MPGESDARILALALHNAHKFLTDKNRRLLEASGDFPRFARIFLAAEYDARVDEASAQLRQLNPEHTVHFGETDYPSLLQEIDHAPFFLYLRGERALLSAQLVSIVGTREPSDGGRKAAAQLAAIYVREGKTVVSGIARGIDSIAHHAALKCNGKTIAVLPNGFDHLYPLENRDLYEQAKSQRDILLISEYPPQQKPQRHHFVRRNRLIAGLSPLTVFVEGSVKSGGMITVNHALREGRDVAALAHASLTQNTGGEKLIADGALDLTKHVWGEDNRQVSA